MILINLARRVHHAAHDGASRNLDCLQGPRLENNRRHHCEGLWPHHLHFPARKAYHSVSAHPHVIDSHRFRIEEFQRKLAELIHDAALEQAVVNECIKVQNRIALHLTFYEKFCKLWESIGFRDR